jgi:hypothetical protein
MASRKFTLTLLLSVSAVVYLAIVVSIYRERHLNPPAGKPAKVPAGELAVTRHNSYQIPPVFESQTVSFEKLPGDTYRLVGTNGQSLPLVDAADGFYFSEDFKPAGAFILPGIARNWNEGRVSVREDVVLVEGYMLERGLMLFVFPFKDIIGWQLELRPATEPGVGADSR